MPKVPLWHFGTFGADPQQRIAVAQSPRQHWCIPGAGTTA